MCGEKENEIRFIQGDVVEIYFEIDGIEREVIGNVYFSCIAGDILCELPYCEEQSSYCLRFNSKISGEISSGFYTYDLTLELVDGNRITLLHNEDFIVLKKKNSLAKDLYTPGENLDVDEDEEVEPDGD